MHPPSSMEALHVAGLKVELSQVAARAYGYADVQHGPGWSAAAAAADVTLEVKTEAGVELGSQPWTSIEPERSRPADADPGPAQPQQTLSGQQGLIADQQEPAVDVGAANVWIDVGSRIEYLIKRPNRWVQGMLREQGCINPSSR